MSKGQVLIEAFDWLGGIGDSVQVSSIYDEIVRDVARETGVFRLWEILPGVAAQDLYTLPDHAIGIEHVVWYPTELPPSDSKGLDLSRPTWSTDAQAPIVWLEDLSSQNTVQVYPVPTSNGATGIFILNVPAIGVPPTGNPVVFYRYVPVEAEIPDWLDGLLAIRMAAREARNLGERQDAGLALALDQVSSALIAVVLMGKE